MEYTVVDKYIKSNFSEIETYLFTAKVKDILSIYYVAVRGRDDIEGAVQRVLNRRRIASIKEFVLEGNMFLNTFVLNWTNKDCSVEISEESLKIPMINASAQVIDGQHRLEGLKMAIEEQPEIEDKKIVVILTQNLSTKEAAKIFLNINTEQKPVPQSLVYDLFGEVKDSSSYLVRATDIARELHDDKDSPYYQCIKLPKSSKGMGKVDLSTIVNSLKNYMKPDGILEQYRLNSFEVQYKILCNFFNAIKCFYVREGCWLNNKNPFMSNAGFFAAVKFLYEDLLRKCVEEKTFEVEYIKKIINLDEIGLLLQADIKNKQGKEQRAEIYKYLKNSMLKDVPNQNEYRF